MKRYFYLIVTGIICHIITNSVIAQQIVVQAHNQSTGGYLLECTDLPKLYPYTSNSPQPSYGMFWIFEDDGSFSFSDYPVHQFNSLNNNVSVEATPRYTPINKKPNVICQLPSAPTPIIPAPNPDNAKFPFINYNKSVYLQAYGDPFYNHERTLILSYENPTKFDINNVIITLYFDSSKTTLLQSNTEFNLYNKILNSQNQFVGGIKAYNEEVVISSPVVMTPVSGNFNSCIVIQAPKIHGYSSHNIYFRFLTDILLGQVNMEAEIHAVFADTTITQSVTLDEFVVSGYDPNSISVDKDTICYHQLESFDTLTYTVHFQNEGNGPTQGVKVLWPYIHDLEIGSVVHIESKHESLLELPLARLAKWIEWDFNLSLPGTHQEGFECDLEATKGWLQFSVETYNSDYYYNHFGPEFDLESTAIIEFPGVSVMETMPAMTVFTDDCAKSASWLNTSEIVEKSKDFKIERTFVDDNGQLHVRFVNTSISNTEVFLYDLCGKLIFKSKMQSGNDKHIDMIIQTNDMDRGLYILKASAAGVMASKKIIL
jgi:hypothetical protein